MKCKKFSRKYFNWFQFLLIIIVPFSVFGDLMGSSGALIWPINCIPGDGTCFEQFGYPDIDCDGFSFNCGKPGYTCHQGTDISISWEAMDKGVSVFAAADGEVLWVFDGKYDRCPNPNEPDCKSPPSQWFEAGQSNGYRVCTELGNYCDSGSCCCFWCFDGGNVIVIKHKNIPGIFATRYDHLKRGSILVTKGQIIKQGQKIAEVGSSGNSSGPHLHFEVWGDGFYKLTDPWVGSCGPRYSDSLWKFNPPWDSIKPTITSLAINNGASSTKNRAVILNNLMTGNPSYYLASQSSNFSDAIWQSYSTSPLFTLNSGNGTKFIYLKVKNHAGIESDIISDTIILNEEIDQKPYFENVSLPPTVAIPDKIYFSGNARDDKGIKRVAITVSGPKGSNIQAFSAYVSGTIVNLSSYLFDSNNLFYAGVPGNYQVTLSITDTGNQVSSTTFNVNVTGTVIDLPPYFVNMSLPSIVTIPNKIYFSGNARDDKGLKRMAITVSGPKGNNIQAFSAFISGTNVNLFNYFFDSNNMFYAGVSGSYRVTVSITDTRNQTASRTFNVTVTNGPDQKPYFENVSLPSTVTIPNKINFSGNARDDKGIKTISIRVSGPKGNNIPAFSAFVGGSIVNLSNYSFDSNSTFYAGLPGNYTVTLTITDTLNQTTSRTFNVTVNSQ